MTLDAVTTIEDLGPVGSELGKGGQASVFELEDHPELVFKHYRPGLSIDSDALDELIGWRRGLDDADLKIVDAQTCWPRSRVVSDDQTVGVVFRRAPERFQVKLKSGNVKLRELQFLFLPGPSRRIGVDVPRAFPRAQVIGQLAELLAFLQDHGVVHGDLSMKNILWSHPEQTLDAVFLLDCDGARANGSRSPLPQVTTPGWTDPRIIKGTISDPDSSSDVYGLGLCFYRCYYGSLGEHEPSNSTLKLPVYPPIDGPMMELTAATLSAGGERPSAKEWVAGLARMLADLSDESTPLGHAYQAERPKEQQSLSRSAPKAPSSAPESPSEESTKAATAPQSAPSAAPISARSARPSMATTFLAISVGILVGAIVALIILVGTS